ncbi:MAG TPA: hypothetical protein VGE41_02995 [Verrucomicrobiae bacterium]
MKKPLHVASVAAVLLAACVDHLCAQQVQVTATAPPAPAVSVVATADKLRELQICPVAREIVKMSDAGLDATVIQSYVDSTTLPVMVRADDIIYLHDHGIPTPIINSLVQRNAKLRDQMAVAATAAPQQLAQPATPAPQVVYTPPLTAPSYVDQTYYTAPAPYYSYYDYGYPYYSSYYWYGRPAIGLSFGFRPFGHFGGGFRGGFPLPFHGGFGGGFHGGFGGGSHGGVVHAGLHSGGGGFHHR